MSEAGGMQAGSAARGIADRLRGRETALTAAALAALALLPRLLLLPCASRMGLGLDETQSAIYARLPLTELLRSLELYDPHPPLYYLQLKLWLLGGTSDAWLRLNSIGWSVLAVLALFYAARRLHGLRPAALAGALLAVWPLAVGFALELRMYSLLLLAAVGVWYFTHRFAEQGGRLAALGLLLSSLVFIYSHGAGFLILPAGWAYFLLHSRGGWPRLSRYTLHQAALLALYLPWLSRAPLVNPQHGVTPGPAELAYTFTQLLFGNFAVLSGWRSALFWLASALFAALLIVLLAHPASRRLAAAFGLAPLLAAYAVSSLLEPVWLTRTLLFTVPFLCLGIALALSELAVRRTGSPGALLQALALEAVVLGALLGAVYQQGAYAPWSPLKESAALLREQARPGDVIYIPFYKMYWGFGWYYSGPGAVHPLYTPYLLEEGGVTLVGRTALAGLQPPGGRLWIVRRDSDDLGPLRALVESAGFERVAAFRGVFVDRIEAFDGVLLK